MHMQRRSFVKLASLAAAGNAMGLKPFGALNALAQQATDYKALVCIFLYGGNDANNMIVPFDSKGYANYANLRGPLALPQSSLLQLAQLPEYSFHPNLPELQGLFDSGQAAVVANVGTLVSPITRSQLHAGASIPGTLLSHTAQQEEWQSATAQTSSFSGWGGRIGDILTSSYNPAATIPMNTTVNGNVLFSNGASTSSISVPPGSFNFAACSEGAECESRVASAQRILKMSSGISLVTAESAIGTTAFATMQALIGSISSASGVKTVFPVIPWGRNFSKSRR